ncbi:MAG: hypothetical protein PWR32_453, partial [Candidatus Woesearchaeota archaeon]|nr:hypothetical protein [Candidatus Woesearchaeota archaeon]
KKPIAAIFSFMSAAFSRTEIFLLFPFFIAQYWYVNNIDLKFEDFFVKIKRLNLKRKTVISIVIIFLTIILWFFATNLSAFYSQPGILDYTKPFPSVNKNKAIFSYLYYHFTYNVTSRTKENLLFMIRGFYFNLVPSLSSFELSSTIVFSIFIVSLILGIKKKEIQVFGFNVAFFFIIYNIIWHIGFVDGFFRYTVYPTYFMSLIFPQVIEKLKQKISTQLIKKLILFFLILLTITFVKETSSIKNFSSKVYLPFNESEIKNLKLNLNEKCSFLFITDYNPLVLESVSIHKSKFLLLETSYEKLKLKENIEEMKNKNECIYTIIPSTAKHDGEISPPFYEQAIGEKWCSNYQDCEDKIKKTINNLKELNFTLMLPFNKSKDDLGGIYYWEKPENQI